MRRKFGQIVSPLERGSLHSEVKIGDLLSSSMGFQDRGKHSDCWAEPFSNYLREQRHGYSRRACQLSNLIRAGELTREKALELLAEHWEEEAARRNMVLDRLGLSTSDLDAITSIPPRQYERYVAEPNALGRHIQAAYQLGLRARARIRDVGVG